VAACEILRVKIMEIVRNNHNDIYPASGVYVRSVRAGGMLYVSGCTARESDAHSRTPSDQLRVTLDRIIRIVEAEGGSPSSVVRLTTYVTNMKDFWPPPDDHIQIYRDFFGEDLPANSVIGVDALADPKLLVEIDTVAALG